MKKSLPGPSRKLADFIPAMLAKETEQPFDDKDWVFEIKWDGYRAIAEVNKTNVSLYSRNGNTFNNSYPTITEELKKLKINAVLDGEIVVLDENGLPSFQLLQYYQTENNYPIVYYVFDVLAINGQETYDIPLIQRKELLKKLLPENEIIKYSDHIEAKGKAFFEAAKKQDIEGVMAKKADSLYYPGKRTNEWLKIKHHKTQDVIIAGYTEPTGGRKYFGALVLAIRGKDGRLEYAGHTGSGFDYASLKEMYHKLQPLVLEESPFDEKIKTNTPATWVKPVLVCEVKYSEKTRDGKMRHPIFMHLRTDKTAKEVTVASTKPITKKQAEKEPATGPNEKELSFGKTKVKTTNLNKVFFPGEGITKGDVINYYQSIAEYILPYLKGRPQSLKRNPNGIADEGFFQKDAGDEAPDWVKSIEIYSESGNKHIDYILCENKATLAYLNNLGCIEINPWHSTIKKLDNPDYLIIDIDPSKKNTFEQVIETALVIHEILEKAGASNFCKTSGATGLHVYVPMGKKYTYEQIKDFAHVVCMLAQQQLPKFTSLERNLKKRGDKMIYLDHLQNRRGQTIACVYSLRPKPGATVSAPLLWDEVKPGLSPSQFTIYNMVERIKNTGDIFKEVLGKGIDMQQCLENLTR